MPSQLEVPSGWKLDSYGPSKYGGGNFGSVLPLRHSKSVWSSMGVWILICFFPWTLQVNLKYHGGGNLYIILSLSTCQINLNFHKGLKSWYHGTVVDTTCQIEVPGGWEFWYSFTLADIPCQCEAPCGWESWYLPTLVNMPSQFEVPLACESWYHITLGNIPCQIHVKFKFHGDWDLDIIQSLSTCHLDIIQSLSTCQVSLKFHGGGNFDVGLNLRGCEDIISSYPCGHSMSIWKSR
jgi:hypothetical protein